MIVKRKELQNVASRNVKNQPFTRRKPNLLTLHFHLKIDFLVMSISFKMDFPPYHSFWSYA